MKNILGKKRMQISFPESYEGKTILQIIKAWSQTWNEEAVTGVHYKTMKGHWFLGVRSQAQTLRGEKEDEMWLSETFGSNFSPTWQQETEIDVAESAAINNSPCEEPGAVLMMLWRSCTSCRSGFILPDAVEDILPGFLLWMPMARQTLKPWQGGSLTLYSYLWRKNLGKREDSYSLPKDRNTIIDARKGQ